MAESIKIKKGLDIKLKGKAEDTKEDALQSQFFSMRPDDFHGMTPKVAVKEGDAVKVGSVLFCDKANPELKVVSPCSGTVVAVNRGERRKVLDIRLESDGKFESVPFEKAEPSQLKSDDVKKRLLECGFFAFINQRPYDVVANPNDAPKAIFISGFDSAPLAPSYDYVFGYDQCVEDLQRGVDALAKLTSGKVYVSTHKDSASRAFKELKNVSLYEFEGPHPAGNVGVQIHHISPINKGEIVWTISPYDVLAIGKAFGKGSIDFSRLIALVGSSVEKPKYYKTYPGAEIASVVKGQVKEENVRYISGNPLTGTQVGKDGFIGAFAHQITVIPEGNKNNEFLGWIMPRLSKFSTSRSYFSWLLGDKEYVADTNVNGGKRAFIMSGEYDAVFPMDVLPEFLVKAIMDKDIDKMEQLGIYEVAPEDFALCEYVCTSKIETQKIVREGLDFLRKELA
ncbi:MAG: Na(+)-translocating NADH-quinone reductase subunit A [Paludibacteraceae bacterium]|nr:Na(+)-translocating NADH-quinone reductase subunit A [Paludibacteraceae bacterium]